MKIKIIYFLLLLFLLNSCSFIGLEGGLYSEINSFEAKTTSGDIVAGDEWKNYIGNDSSIGDFIAFRTPSRGPYQGLVLIATSLNEFRKAIEVGGRPMDPGDQNVLDALTYYTPLIEIIGSDPELIYSSIFSNSTSKTGIVIGSDSLTIASMNFGNYLPLFARGLLPSGYLSIVDNDLFIVGGRGPILIVDNQSNKIIEIDSNLKEIIDSQDYISMSGGSDISGRMGVRDTFYDSNNQEIYISMITKNIEDCFGIGIFKADARQIKDERSLLFNIYYKTDTCVSNVNFQQSGGKIQKYLDGLLFTVGDFDQNIEEVLLDPSNEFGKIIYIENGIKVKNFSTGHRNPQGLLVSKGLIYSTEHGPKGGDEINLIKENQFYGWPIYSYGVEYSGEDIYKSPHEDGAIEPLYYFTPSIAISEIVRYEGDEFLDWEGQFLIASLKDQSLYLVIIEEDKSISSVRKIPIERRIRDITIDDDGVIWLITDDAMLVKITNEK